MHGHPSGPGPWTTPVDHPYFFEDEFYSRSKRVLRTLYGRICVNKLLPGLWAPRTGEGGGGYRVGRREKWPENVGRREKMKCCGCRKISMRRYYYGFF